MNRIFLTLWMVLAFAGVYAQQGFHVGASGSFNGVWIVNQNAYGGTEFKYKLRLGGGAGVDIGYNFTDHIGLQTGYLYSSQGQNYADSKTPSILRNYGLTYNCIPIMLKYTGGNSNVKFYAQAGPRFSFLNSATLYNAFNFTNETIDGKDRFTKDDLGITFGLGANIGITNNIYVNIGMNFFYSFNDINSNGPTTDPHAYYGPKGTDPGSWHWPWYYNGIYSPSRNATGGINAGIHYLIPTGKHHHH